MDRLGVVEKPALLCGRRLQSPITADRQEARERVARP